jgi:chromate transport protein ChrA
MITAKESITHHGPRKPSLPQLFLFFLGLGTTVFDGPAMVAYIRRTTVEQKHWIDEKTFRN